MISRLRSLLRRRPDTSSLCVDGRWVAVNPAKEVVATGMSFEELSQQPGFDRSRDKVYEYRDGKWWHMFASYRIDGDGIHYDQYTTP